MSLDRWLEILSTLGRNRLRTFLTMLSVAWGILMLVVLQGAGQGLSHGTQEQFKDDAVNSIWMFAGRTTIPYGGYPVGRRLTFDNGDYDALRDAPGVEHLTGRYGIRGGGFFGGEVIVRRGDKSSSFDVRSVHPDHLYLEKTIMVAGRFLNQRDLDGHRKVAVIGMPVRDFLFGPGADPMGQWIEVNGVAFQVVGVFTDEGGEGELRKVYLPITTAQRAFGGNDRINMLMFTVGDADVAESQALADQAIALMAEHHDFAPADKQAVRVRNNVEAFDRFNKIFKIIELFVWVIGLGTIVAGIVGVSNIMMIAVKERTKEIGVRKALGATPSSIITMIVEEAVFLTAIAGYVGLVAGVAILQLVAAVLPANDFFSDPTVDLGLAIKATVILIVAGALAGYFPARAAARVNPIVALRDQ
ncbi:MAG: ABC transporter permease [Kofleriaceae bacterium]|nr:ABC transporter permease [Myxococcales bacterium]MCB9564363.1 ABC transporter permease [Kofleriaceae bacterium]MCB9575227.1 ABC transporter permease [Kofleriaceae bacterium]